MGRRFMFPGVATAVMPDTAQAALLAASIKAAMKRSR
jgi:hypothetical protein